MKLNKKQFAFLLAACLANSLSLAQTKANEVYKIAGHGFLALVDCRNGGESSDYAEGAEKIRGYFGVPVSNVVDCSFSLDTAASLLKRSGGAMAVFIVDDSSLPMTLTASEERWAMVNAANLDDDDPDKKTYRRRLSLLLTRQCCRVLGGDEVKGYSSCFHVVLGVKDLDEITSFDITMGPELSVREAMPLRGILPPVFGTYEDACEMGLAHQPTNAYQRAIWEKIHAPPKTPLRIKFDPATQKGRVTK